MKSIRFALAFLMLSLSSCESTVNEPDYPTDASQAFANAINSQDIEAAMAHWSDGAVLYFQSGDAEAVAVSRDEIRQNYEHMLEEGHGPTLEIRVNGLEHFGDTAHEWGSFKMGESVGCYVILRRAIDDWKIFREWIVEPCGH